jgi:hypothetical protein
VPGAADALQQATEAQDSVGENATELSRGKAMLAKEAADRRRLISDLHRVREELGISLETFYEAKRKLGMVTTDENGAALTPSQAKGKSGLYWSLPGTAIEAQTVGCRDTIIPDQDTL